MSTVSSPVHATLMTCRTILALLVGPLLWSAQDVSAVAEDRTRPDVPGSVAATFRNRDYRWLEERETVDVGRYVDYHYQEDELPPELRAAGVGDEHKRRAHFEQWQGAASRWLGPWMTSLPEMSIEAAADRLAMKPRHWSNPCYVRGQLSGKQQVLVGIAAAGRWFTDRDGAPHFIPDTEFTVRKKQRQERLGWEPLGYVTGGGVQYHVLGEDIRWTGVWSRPEPLPKPFSDPLPNAVHQTLNVKAVSDPAPIQARVQKYGVFPGGILIESKPVSVPAAERVEFDPQRRVFLVDGRLEFHPGLSEDECAQVERVVANKADRRLAALSQVECLGVSPQSSVGSLLGEADTLLGRLMYGYDLHGLAMPSEACPSGYRNPLFAATEDYRDESLSAMVRDGRQCFRGHQPRLFLSFEAVRFARDPARLRLTRAETTIRIHYDVFRYNQFNEVEFAEGDPRSHEPHVVDAIRHLAENYEVYEARFPILERVRRVAELYAFLTWAHDSVPRVDFSRLNQSRAPVTVPANRQFYSHIDEQSDLKVATRQRLDALKAARQFRANELSPQDRMWLAIAQLEHALDAEEAATVPPLRQQAIVLAWQVLPAGYSDSVDRPHAGDVVTFVRHRDASRAAGLKEYARRVGEQSDEGEAALRRAAAWYERLAIAEPDLYSTHRQLEWLREKLGDPAAARAAHEKAVRAAEPAAKEEDREAEAFLGEHFSEAKELETAGTFYLAAATHGHPAAKYVVHSVYKTSPTQRDDKEAAVWLTRAAESGHPRAMLDLGLAYSRGEHRSQDLGQARIWLTRATRNGVTEAAEPLKQLK